MCRPLARPAICLALPPEMGRRVGRRKTTITSNIPFARSGEWWGVCASGAGAAARSPSSERLRSRLGHSEAHHGRPRARCRRRRSIRAPAAAPASLFPAAAEALMLPLVLSPSNGRDARPRRLHSTRLRGPWGATEHDRNFRLEKWLRLELAAGLQKSGAVDGVDGGASPAKWVTTGSDRNPGAARMAEAPIAGGRSRPRK